MTYTKCTFAFVLDMERKWHCPPHHHYCTELAFCYGCSGEFFYRKQRIAYGDGDVIVCQPGESHWIENAEPGRQVCFGMDGANAETIPIGVYAPTEELLQIREMLFQSFTGTSPCRNVRVDLLCGLAAVAITSSLNGHGDVATKMERVKELVEAGYSEQWDTTSLAYEVGLSPDYLRQVFRARYGISVARHLREVRLKAAVRLLESTGDPIRQIAKVCGFGDPSYFSKVFRRRFDQTPAAYRTSRRAEPDLAEFYNDSRVLAVGNDPPKRPQTRELQTFLVSGDPGSPIHVRGPTPLSDGQTGEE